MVSAISFLVLREHQRNPELSLSGWKSEAWRHDSSDHVLLAVECYVAADESGVGAEIGPPQLVAKDGHMVAARGIFAGIKGSAQDRIDCKRCEEVGRHLGGVNLFGIIGGLQIEASGVVG